VVAKGKVIFCPMGWGEIHVNGKMLFFWIDLHWGSWEMGWHCKSVMLKGEINLDWPMII
jgi:hypothetical protein